MTCEIVINKHHTSIVESYKDIDNIDVFRYNQREKDLMAFFPQARRRMVNTTDFYTRLSTIFSQKAEILPNGCKYFNKVGTSHKVFVIEEPPRIRSIFVDTGIESLIEKLRKTGKLEEYGYDKNKLFKNKNNAYVFQLAFPFVIFIITVDLNNNLRQLRPFLRLHSVTSLNDYLLKAPLYNIPSDQSMCLGNVATGRNTIESIENIIERFWLNIYNHDYSNNIVQYQESDQHELQDYLSWMYYTKQDPMFIYGAKWLKYKYNIGQTIASMTGGASTSKPSQSFVFKSILDTAFETSSEIISKTPEEKNISYSIMVKDDILSVGDELLFNDKKMYLYSVIGDSEGITFVELEDEDGEIISVPTQEFEDNYNSIFKASYLDEIEVNGVTVKSDDVICITLDGFKIYKKIKNLRKARDGKIEAFIGNEHYLLEKIDFSVMKIEKIEINGKTLEIGDKTLIATNTDNYSPIYTIKNLKYYDLTINNRGEIILKFDDGFGFVTNVNYNKLANNDTPYEFVNENSLEKVNATYYFDRLLVSTEKEIEEGIYFSILKNKGLVPYVRTLRGFLSEGIFNKSRRDAFFKDILIEDGKRLLIKGIYHDIDFKIGDPIVYANWGNPDDMLNVLGIESFLIKDDHLYVIAKSIDKTKEFEIPFISIRYSRINIGVIRKVYSKYNGWSVGDKIKANVAGIYNFPKKDTNQIIAFVNIPGAKYPIALCSNLCTLWMNQLTIDSFTRITPKEARWKKLEVTPFDLSKIRWQHGDLYKTKMSNIDNDLRDSIYFLVKRHGTQYAFDYSHLSSWGNIEHGSTISKNTLNDRKIRHGILMPRFQITNHRLSATKRGYPNMLGGFHDDSNSRLLNMSDQFREDF